MRNLPGAVHLLVASFLLPAAAFSADLRIAYIDVGQGDAEVIIAPSGCAAVIDGGPTGSGAAIKAYLHSQGVTQIDFGICSHFHADHLGGLDEVAQGADGIPFTKMYDRGGSYSSTAYTQYANQFAGIRQTVTRGQTFSLCNEVTFEVVSVNGNGVSSSDENGNSVGVKVSFGAFRALFGGDLPYGGSYPAIEQTLIGNVGPVDIYKVHHHGSRTSSLAELLAELVPTVSVIEVGKNNTYGHPTPEVISRLQAVNSTIYQTEDPATNSVRGNVVVSTTTGASYIVTQGGTSTPFTSKGGGGGGGDTTPPTAPGNLTATASSSSSIDLSWTASTDNVGVTGYHVHRSTNGNSFSLAGTVTTTAFADTGLNASTTYWYRVTAIDAAGNESADSNTASATTSSSSSSGQMIINEILANEVGSNTGGEFVELVNVGGSPVDISGWKIYVKSTARHTFAAGTTIQPGKAIVVFASASFIPGGLTNAVAASTGSLVLTNSGATVSLRDGSTTIDSFKYSSSLSSTDGVSMNRDPDATAEAPMVLHTAISALKSSAGTRASGAAF